MWLVGYALVVFFTLAAVFPVSACFRQYDTVTVKHSSATFSSGNLNLSQNSSQKMRSDTTKVTKPTGLFFQLQSRRGIGGKGVHMPDFITPRSTSADDSCLHSKDNECDEPHSCDYGTDTTDCAGKAVQSSKEGGGSAASTNLVEGCSSSGCVLLGTSSDITPSTLESWANAGIEQWVQGTENQVNCNSVCEGVGLKCEHSSGRFPHLDQKTAEALFRSLGQSCSSWAECTFDSMGDAVSACPMLYRRQCWFHRRETDQSKCHALKLGATRFCPCGTYGSGYASHHTLKDSCRYANNGVCNEPDFCDSGTDTSDCARGSLSSNAQNSATNEREWIQSEKCMKNQTIRTRNECEGSLYAFPKLQWGGEVFNQINVAQGCMTNGTHVFFHRNSTKVSLSETKVLIKCNQGCDNDHCHPCQHICEVQTTCEEMSTAIFILQVVASFFLGFIYLGTAHFLLTPHDVCILCIMCYRDCMLPRLSHTTCPCK